MQQLVLDLQPPQAVGLEDFHPGHNAELVTLLQGLAAGAGEPYLFFWGGPGTGKTHLLQATAQLAHRAGRRAAYLPLGTAGLEGPDRVVEGLEVLDLVCLDDLQRVAGDPSWEEALFHLYNRLRALDRALIVSADQPLAALPLGLADLRSRLAWGPSYRVHPLDDGESLELLRTAAHRLGMALPEGAARYILHRCPRDPGHLLGLVQALGRLALERQQRPSIRLARELLQEAGGGDAGAVGD